MRLAAKVTAGVLILDQVTKYIVVQGLHLDRLGAIDVIPPFLNFRMAWNRGVNFGLFSGETDAMRWVLILVALAISAWVWFWIAREPHSRKVHVSAGLLVGGALGNVVDRLVYGAVADFLNMSLPGWTNPYSFNVADITIFLGAVGLVLFTGKDNRATER
ncbi:MAG: signal peptidase II [Thioclava marina]|jgi:signal peptidase II (EC:3.4.23.36). Aspartic peptidase. MEROPS family A08|uniref:Lipoprotein signal peptidase n=1 Tax=Thioclava marina TaxID=1915077 RepID=A0ABX3MRB8_9RHOB|nr:MULTISPECIES: signal peptidase II [Thioclava]TNE93143.1 MAG: signal peptidase II [Paracoccaceae bacterium]MBC7144530.1 signal peptidase II [Thioclava marina]MBD3803817.1 signal peptidase II [Thioclava sp.]OOY13703.1 signal peptidase II [Thioclava marina]OOY29412.1 signal peptidase II [Thioclava sp. L04-15]